MSDAQNLTGLLEKIRGNLDQNSYGNEAAVRQSIIEPILRSLGWDTENPLIVNPEYSLEGGVRADYALCESDKLFVIIEAKAVGSMARAESQLFKYTYDAGALLAVLTDGREWRIFLTFVTGTEEERLVRNINITDNNPEDAARYLIRYLSHREVVSENAAQNAREDLKKTANLRKSREAIPQVWNKIIGNEDSPIIDELIEKTAAECGNAPDKKDVMNFLKSLRKEASASPPPPQPRSPSPPANRSSPRQIGAAGSRQGYYILFGEKYDHKYASDAYHEVLKKLDGQNPNFMEAFSEAINNNRTIHVARNKRDIGYLGNGQEKPTRKINGWYINMNLSNSEKLGFLMRACEVISIEFGKDLIFKFHKS